MYYRRKILLALLEVLDRPVPSVEMQKYLFLLCVRQQDPAYEFVPYRYGCYSLQADADKRTLTKYGHLLERDDWVRNGSARFAHLLKPADRRLMLELEGREWTLRGNELIRHVYRGYPYYAINSEIGDRILDTDDQEAVRAARPIAEGSQLSTIGYEGKPLEGFLNQLIRSGVRVLCDVRRNPVSMKFGFSKRQLSGAVEKLGMRYIHMPELGIPSVKRRAAESKQDFEDLFQEYRRTTLVERSDALANVVRLLDEHERVALTCFERNHEDCHRGCIADALLKSRGFQYVVAHL